MRRSLVSFINCALLIATYALYSYTDSVYVAKNIDGGMIVSLKYVTLFALILFCLMQLSANKEHTIYLKRELVNICFFFYGVLMLSIFTSIFLETSFKESLVELFKMLLPLIAAYCILNTFEFVDIYRCMQFILIFSIIGYILEIGIDTFTVENILRINFSNSYSPFESHYAAGASIAMCVFFMYYRNNKIFTLVSLIFALGTFKRVSVVFALILLILPVVIDLKNDLNVNIRRIIPIVFIIATVCYYYMNQPENAYVFEKIFNMDAQTVTMGRSNYIERIVKADQLFLGLGHTTTFIGKSIEMDFVKLLLETTVVGLSIFIYTYYTIAGENIYCNVYMMYVFFNLLTSHSLSNSFSWLLIYLIIGTIRWKQESDLSYLRYEERRSRKKRSTIGI